MLYRIAIPVLWACTFVMLMADVIAVRPGGGLIVGRGVLLLVVFAGAAILWVETRVMPGLMARPWSRGRKAAATLALYYVTGLVLGGLVSVAANGRSRRGTRTGREIGRASCRERV